MYTAQIDRNRNVIVCRGDDARNGYVVAFYGTYADCLAWKLANGR